MPDRVKEAAFSILGCRFETPGRLPPIRVADVFAGSGALGLEALSRGAASCVFYERDPGAAAVLRRNLQDIEAGGEASIVMRDAWRAAIPADKGDPFHLVLLDPHYSDSEDVSLGGHVWRYLERLAGAQDDCPVVVLHHRAGLSYEESVEDPWRVVDHRTFGTNALTIFAP